MRIACVSTSKVPGITANALQLMKACQALRKLGHEVKLWLPDYGDRINPRHMQHVYGLDEPIPIRRVFYVPGLLRYDFCLWAVLGARRWGADLLYTWAPQAAAMGARLGPPTILEMHDEPSGRLGPWLFRTFLHGPQARRMLVTTRALQQRLEAQFDADQVRALSQVAPNGVDLERYAELPEPEAARRQLDLPDHFTAVYTGHLYPGRGAELMFALARALPQVMFLLAGGNPQTVAEWRQRARTDGVGNLKFLGFLPQRDLPAYQAAGDVLLMPYGERVEVSGGGDSSAVASPMKAFEYMAAGRAILSSDLPVLREILDEAWAVLLPPDDVERWQRAIESLRQDEDRRRQLGARAREQAEKHSWVSRARRALAGLDG